MSNKVQFGLENVHVAFRNSGDTGWDTPVPIPGAVTLSLSPEGSTTKYYADNIEYFPLDTNNGYSGDIEFALIPDSMLADMLGWEIDVNGMLVETLEDASGVAVERRPFALLYEVKGNERNKRYVFYKCLASRPESKANTQKDSTEVDAQTLSIEALPIEVDSRPVVKAACELVNTQSAWAAATAYGLGDLVLGGTDVYECTTAGTSDSSEPTWPGSGTVTDGTVTWTYLGPSNATVYNAWYTAVQVPTYAAA